MSDEEERTDSRSIIQNLGKTIPPPPTTTLPDSTRLPFPVTCGVDKLDAFATLARLTNSEGSCSLLSKSVHACMSNCDKFLAVCRRISKKYSQLV